MKTFGIIMAVLFGGVLLIGIIAAMSGVGIYNGLVSNDEAVSSAWSQVENVYQRRMDLIPNLVETVKGYAAHEKSTFTEVTEARAKVSQMNVDASKLTTNPEMMQNFIKAQEQLSGALSRLLVTVERYPDLKANQNFLNLQHELAGTENRVSVERKRYNDAVKILNQKIRVFPSNIIAGMFNIEKRVYFEAEEGANKAPKVSFN